MNIETTGAATYCPEDNKLRLYVGRVPRPEYDALRVQGWTATPKQACDFVATWTPGREDTALDYAPDGIDDEDQSPADRAADRAERFGGYCDKRADEAGQQADRYESGPSAHGHQSRALAERRAARHDLQGTRAVNLWEKAEYWQRRTAGVISHALHVAAPGVRMGRIKEIEAALRRQEKHFAEYSATYRAWQTVLELGDTDAGRKRAEYLAEFSHCYEYKHPRPESMLAYLRETGTSLSTLLGLATDPITPTEAAHMWMVGKMDPVGFVSRWAKHYELRLAYENQMLEAQGGRAAFVEMEAGGFIGTFQIQKVNKSTATGRVVSVNVLAPSRQYSDGKGKVYGPDYPPPLTTHTLKVERMGANVYRAPTDEERAAFAEDKKEARKAAAAGPKGPSLTNPTDEDAERLQALWNDAARARFRSMYDKPFLPAVVLRMTQGVYTANSTGTYARAGTMDVCRAGYVPSGHWSNEARARDAAAGPVLCKVRATQSPDKEQQPERPDALRVIVITDKPQKELPLALWASVASPAAVEQRELVLA